MTKVGLGLKVALKLKLGKLVTVKKLGKLLELEKQKALEKLEKTGSDFPLLGQKLAS